MFTILDTFAAGTSILFTVLCQVIAVSWFYGRYRRSQEPAWSFLLIFFIKDQRIVRVSRFPYPGNEMFQTIGAGGCGGGLGWW